MPVTKTAKRALRAGKRKEAVNKLTATRMDIAIRTAKKKKVASAVSLAFSAIDRAAKVNIIHKNKAARLKSQLAKLIKSKPVKKTTAPKKKSSR